LERFLPGGTGERVGVVVKGKKKYPTSHQRACSSILLREEGEGVGRVVKEEKARSFRGRNCLSFDTRKSPG